MDKLKPCPFCGSEAIILEPMYEGFCCVCAGCGLIGSRGEDPREARDLWNTRTPSPTEGGDEAVKEIKWVREWLIHSGFQAISLRLDNALKHVRQGSTISTESREEDE